MIEVKRYTMHGAEHRAYRRYVVDSDQYREEVTEIAGKVEYVRASDYDREHELRLQAERERDRLREHADAADKLLLSYQMGHDLEADAVFCDCQDCRNYRAYRKEFGE